MATKAVKKATGSEFAIIDTGGKQYKVMAGDTITIEKLAGYSKGDTVLFDKVLLTENAAGTTVGEPYVKGATVKAEFIEYGREAKVRVVKYKAKARYLKQNGHRQPFTKVKITSLA